MTGKARQLGMRATSYELNARLVEHVLGARAGMREQHRRSVKSIAVVSKYRESACRRRARSLINFELVKPAWRSDMS